MRRPKSFESLMAKMLLLNVPYLSVCEDKWAPRFSRWEPGPHTGLLRLLLPTSRCGSYATAHTPALLRLPASPAVRDPRRRAGPPPRRVGSCLSRRVLL